MLEVSKILTFVVPSYNCEKFLDKCLSSFADSEVLDKLEIIVVNDGSSDGTEKIALSYAEKYPDSFRVISQENKGHGGALNTGIGAAAGKYVKAVDADDWVETGELPTFVSMLEECSSDVVLTHHYTIDVGTGEIKKWKSFPEKFGVSYDFIHIMNNWKSFDRSLTFHGITYNTAFYKKYGMQLSEHVFYEDHEYATVPCCYAKSITPFDIFVYDYRVGDVEQSVSEANQLKRLGHTQTVLERFLSEYPKLRLKKGCYGRKYFCMKAQGLLLSYLRTALLVEPDRKKGREEARYITDRFKNEIRPVYDLAKRQYKAFMMMNRSHVSLNTFEKILSSKLYNKLRGNHDFN